MNNEIKINVPEGMEIDIENSTFDCIKFKPKWVPKRGDIAVAGDDSFCKQIILIAEYIKPNDIVGFDIKPLAILSSNNLSIYDNSRAYKPTFWVKQEASASEKEKLIKELNKKGYVYNSDDPRIIYKKEKELPKTWGEFCNMTPIKEGEVYINAASTIVNAKKDNCRGSYIDANILPSKEYAEAMLALCKLIQLRECYNDGWQADWSDSNQTKYAITYCGKEIIFSCRGHLHAILIFKTSDLRDAFYNNFIDLIEKAKILL